MYMCMEESGVGSLSKRDELSMVVYRRWLEVNGKQ